LISSFEKSFWTLFGRRMAADKSALRIAEVRYTLDVPPVNKAVSD
jgi:hypothetical protein